MVRKKLVKKVRPRSCCFIAARVVVEFYFWIGLYRDFGQSLSKLTQSLSPHIHVKGVLSKFVV